MGNRIRSAILVAGLLLAAACTGSDGDDGGQAVLPTSVADGDATAERSVAAGLVGEPGSIDELEAVWAESRLAVITKLRVGDYGVNDDGFLIGPGDFTVDLTRCPRNWTDEPAPSDGIVIGHAAGLADYGPLVEGIRAYFDHVNDGGGIHGRLISYEVVDDQLIPTKTIEAVDDWVESQIPLAVSTFSTPTSQAVYDQLNEQCIPQPFVGSAHPAWGDPRRHPWTTGLQLSYATEAILWGNWIKRNLAPQLPVKVVGLVIGNDYGRAYEAAFSRWATANRDVVDEFITVSHEPGTAGVDDEMAEVVAADPDVFVALTAGSGCESAIANSETSGLNDAVAASFVPTACTNPTRFFIPAERAGQGYLAVDGGLKATNDPVYQDDVFVEFINGILSDAGIEDETGLAGIGAGQYAWTYVEALRIAAELEGGLTRTNLLLAVRNLELRHPMVLAGITFAAEGADDAFFIEGARMSRYSAGTATWEPETLVVDLNRATPNCTWDGSDCS